ncbi:hypothetical protein KA107_00605 [Candidatus Pacearchaeota archaeon]|nr:hypothetical protein [Candidatus Pacearchaeota archaeon]
MVQAGPHCRGDAVFEWPAYSDYISVARSLPTEMVKRQVQYIPVHVDGKSIRVYIDGTAEFPTKNQPLLARLGLREPVQKRVGLESLGEILEYLTEGSPFPYNLGAPLTSRGFHMISGRINENTMSSLYCRLKQAEEIIKTEYQPIKGL